MKKKLFRTSCAGICSFIVLFSFPLLTFAHESRTYAINGVEFALVVGSLNEPVIVDDKTGVSVQIARNGVALEGAHEALQVEMIAGNTAKVVNLSPVHGAQGQYKSPFIATVPTTLTYRLFGTLENTPVNLTFTCNPAGHPQAEENTDATEVSEGVTQTLKRGAFGCPEPKEAFGFPEETNSSVALAESIHEINSAVQHQRTNTVEKVLPLAAIIVSLVSLAISFKTNLKRR